VRARLFLSVVVGSLLVLAACGDDDVAVPTPQQAPVSSSTVPISTTVTAASPTTSTRVPPATVTTTPMTATAPPASNALAGFFGSAADLDAAIVAAADLFNAAYDADAATVSAAAATAIDGLDATAVVLQIPPGLSPPLETAVLGVLADLQSRIAALEGAERLLNGDTSNVSYALVCLSNGGSSAGRFETDVNLAVRLAALEGSPTAAPDSVPAGVLAVRVEAIRSMNFGCDSCGGIAYTDPLPVDWEGRTIVDGPEFEASFDGLSWQILIYAC